MMNTLEFLSHLRNLDIQLSMDGDRLKLSAPKGALTPTLKSELSERKAELIAFLKQQAQSQTAELSIPPIETVDRTGELPLSSAQERLWFLRK